MTHVFQFNQVRDEHLQPGEAVRLLEALRHPGEGLWLQTFADGPDELYSTEQKTSRAGRPYTVKRWCVAGVPGKIAGKTRKVTGVAEQWGAVTPETLAGGIYRISNQARCGVFVCVNVLAPEAARRKADQVRRVAAVFIDLDGAPLPASFPLPPTATVESSPGRHHAYWAVDGVPLGEFGSIQRHLAALYGADPKVCDLPRVMRLPGYWHGKSESGFLVQLTSINPEAQYTRADLLEAWPSLAEALAAAEAEQRQRDEDAARRREEAAQLREAVDEGTVGSREAALLRYGQSGLRGLEADLLGAREGTRNSTLNAVAYRAGRMVAAGLLDDAQVRASLTEIAERVGLERGESVTTLSSGLEAGKAEPLDTSGIGTRAGKRKAKSGAKAAAQRVGVEAVRSEVEADDLPEPEGEGGSYSDEQVKAFLHLDWPTVAADTDTAHAHRLRALARDDLGYVAELGGYVAWSGQVWLSGGKDGAGQVEARRRVQGLGIAMRPEVELLLTLYSRLDVAAKRLERELGPDAREVKALKRKASAMEKAYYNHARAARSTEGDGKQKAILSSARPLYVKSVHDFEPRPWLVGFPNGTWDRGEFRPARREDHLLTLAAVPYEPEADQRDWLEVLERITGGDTNLQRTLQEVAGYALSGAATLRVLPWLYGEGGTGKSTFSELLGTVLGDMAATIDPKLFAADAARERLGAAIWGKRVALCSEAGNARLDAEALKTLSGADRLSVRMLYAEAFTARASHVLVMVANDPPRMEAYDDALRDRVLTLPFDHPLKEGGPLLGGRRLEELRQDATSDLVRGFTAWAVEGLTNAHRQGDVYRAPACLAATRKLWREVDPLTEFWLEQDPSDLAIGVNVTAFRKRYETWCTDTATRPLGLQKFNRACRSVGLDVHNAGREKRWKLFERARFPQELTSEGEGSVAHFAHFEAISPKPIFSSRTREEEKEFTETGIKVGKVGKSAQVAAGWEGEEL